MQVIVLVSRCAQKIEKHEKKKIAGKRSEIAVLPAWELIPKKSINLIMGSNL